MIKILVRNNNNVNDSNKKYYINNALYRNLFFCGM